MNKQKNINGDNNEFYISLDLECQLKIPAVIAGVNRQNFLIKNIEIIITNTFNIDNPILIDTNEVYIDNKNKLNNIVILEKKDFSIIQENEKEYILLKLSTDYLQFLNNKVISLYICSDVTDQNPKVTHKKFGIFNIDETNILIDGDFIVFKGLTDKDDEFYSGYLNIGEMSDIRLLIFNL